MAAHSRPAEVERLGQLLQLHLAVEWSARPAAPTFASAHSAANASLSAAPIVMWCGGAPSCGRRPTGRALAARTGEPLADDPLREPAPPRPGRARWSTARACPSLSSSRPIIASTSSGSSSRRTRFETVALRLPDTLRDLAEREVELVEQHGVRARLLDRREILAGDFLDEREKQRVAVVRLRTTAGTRSRGRPRVRRASGARPRSARSALERGRTMTGWIRPCALIDSASPLHGLALETLRG